MPLASNDSNGVPKLDLSNPQAQVLFPCGYYTYAFGNTPAIELTEHFGTSKKDGNLNFLLLGSGDVRNLLFTVSELSQRSQDAIPENLSFHLNDHDASVLARNVIILEIVLSIDPDCERDVDFLWNVWYNLIIPYEHFKRLQVIMDSLISRGYAKSYLEFGSRAVFTESLNIWTDWMDMNVDLQDVLLQRQKLILFGLNLVDPDDMDEEEGCANFISAVTSLTNTVVKQLLTPFDEQKLGRKCFQKSGLIYREIYSYFLSGSTWQLNTDYPIRVNPTLIRPFERKWKVHYGSCPFSGYIPIDGNLLGNCKSATKACKERLRKLVDNFQNFGRSKCGTHSIKVTFWNGDALDLCNSGLSKDMLFDVIDTSNLSDHIGLLNILVCCAKRLKEPGQSQLMTSTMLWRASGLCSLQEYLHYSLGMARTLYPTVLGVKLAEDLNLGKSDIPAVKEEGRVVDRLVWVRAEPERTPISFDRSPDILDALKNMASRCFRLPSPRERCLQLSGVTLSSPLTFFVAFLQSMETLKESAEHVLSHVEESLPAVRLFKKRACSKLCGLSWNALKCLSGLLKGIVLKVEVQIRFPTIGLSRTTPVMQAVVFEDPSDSRFLSVWPVSQLEQRTFHRPVHLFYNNVRYDPDKETASLLMFETDWETLDPESVLILISSTISCVSNAVKLKPSCKAMENNLCCFTNKGLNMDSGKRDVKETILPHKRKSRLARNISCASVSCMSDTSRRDLQNYDSCYRLDILSSQDLVIHNSGHMHSSKDCLVSLDKKPVHLFKSGVDSSSFQLNDDVVLEDKLVNDVGLHNRGYANDEGERRAKVKTEKMDDMGLSDVLSVAMSQATKTDHLQLLALEEHSMCYNADIKIITTFNTVCLSGGPRVEYRPIEMPTAVEISLDSKRKPLTMYFSSPVDAKSSKVQLLADKHRLRCHFPKSELGVQGRACIKRPKTIDLASLSTWNGTKDFNLLMVLTQQDDDDDDDSPHEEKRDFQELQNALRCIIASFLQYPQKNRCFTINVSSDKDATSPSLTLVVHDVFSHNYVPLVKVLFRDHSVISFPSEDCGRNSLSAAKYKEVLLEVMPKKEENPMIHMTSKGQMLLKTLLYTNAKRVRQTERFAPVWTTSLLQLRF